MKFSVNNSDLAGGVKRAFVKPLKNRNIIPILNNVLLTASADGLSIRGTDLDIFVDTKVAADIGEGGVTTVSASRLGELADRLPSDKQSVVSLNGGDLSVNCGKSRYKLATLPAEDFPAPKAIGDDSITFNVPARSLVELLGHSSFAVSDDEHRISVRGIYLHRSQDKIVAVATDGHRLAKISRYLPEGAGGISGYMIWEKTALKIVKLAQEAGENNIQITASSVAILASNGETSIAAKLNDSKFPDYERVIPKDYERSAIVSVPGIMEALKRILSVSSDKTHNRIKVVTGHGTMSLSLAGADGSGEEELGAECSTQVEFVVNGSMLGEILAEIDDAGDCQVEIKFRDSRSPLILTGRGNESDLFIQMPMAL
jgi:DNA polymerase-3 subunit beta